MEKWQNYSRGCTSCGPHILTLHGKPYFLFPDVLRRWFFQKNWAEIWSFLYYWGRWYFFFSKIWSCTLKMKDDLSQKNTRKYYISFKRSEKMVFSKRTTLGYDLYCIISKDGIFSRKHDIFSLDRELGVTFLRKYMEIWYFPCTRTCVTNVAPRPSVKKHQRWSYPAKIHLIVIDVLDWRPIKSFSNSLYFHGDLYRRVHVLLYRAAKQNRKLNI